MNLADSLATYIEQNIAGSNLFVGRIPDSPNNTISVYSRGGPGSDSTLPYDTRTIQLWVRGTDGQETEARAEQAYALLHGKGEMELPNGLWLVLMVGVQSGPVYTGQDDSRRYEYSLNFDVEVLNPLRS